MSSSSASSFFAEAISGANFSSDPAACPPSGGTQRHDAFRGSCPAGLRPSHLGKNLAAPLAAPLLVGASTPFGAPSFLSSSVFGAPPVRPSYASVVVGTSSPVSPAVLGAPHSSFAAPSGSGSFSSLAVSSVATHSDISDPDAADVLMVPQDLISDPLFTSSPHRVLEGVSSASAELDSLTNSGYRATHLFPAAAAATSLFSFQTSATADQRGSPSPREFSRRHKNEQPGSFVTHSRRLHSQPQLLQSAGCVQRLGSCSGSGVAAVAVMLCMACIVEIAAAQKALCSSAWSTAALSVFRTELAAATSLPNQGLAFFAGGGL
jgi:hypothetical protein